MGKKVCVIGHFGEGKVLLNGQTVKTKIITEELQNQLGNEQVLKIDTHGGFKVLLKAPINVLKGLKNCENVIIFPAHNGLRVYAPLLAIARKLFKHRKLHYVVIGGWLPQLLSNKKWLVKYLKEFNGVYVETQTMKRTLDKYGFTNIYVMPNCKKLNILSENELVYPTKEPYKLCTFSRVMKEKGIEDAVCAVKQVNDQFGRVVYTLDIYGQIDFNQTEWFENLKLKFPKYIKYCGCVDADKSVDVLKNYFALLFPTHFYTEGILGTIIDAYAAGVPVISAKWESFDDVVDNDITGVGYDFDNKGQFEDVLFYASKNFQKLFDMKENCICKANNYIPESTIQIMTRKILGR